MRVLTNGTCVWRVDEVEVSGPENTHLKNVTSARDFAISKIILRKEQPLLHRIIAKRFSCLDSHTVFYCALIVYRHYYLWFFEGRAVWNPQSTSSDGYVSMLKIYARSSPRRILEGHFSAFVEDDRAESRYSMSWARSRSGS